MFWIIKQYRDIDNYLYPVINVRSVPFYTVQGRKKKGGRSNRRAV